MTRQKALKKRVRGRMTKTGESYAAARAQVLGGGARPGGGEADGAGGERPGGDAGPPGGAPATAQLSGGDAGGAPAAAQRPGADADASGAASAPPRSDAAVLRATGRGWGDWFGLLDAWGAAGRPHREIARWLRDEHGVSGWWSQKVTVEYELARGLREPGAQSDGTFAGSASKTVNVPVDRLWAAFADPELRERWLPDANLHERALQPGRSARFDWGDDGSRVSVWFTAKGDAKAAVGVEHERLRDRTAAETRKAFWRERLTALKRLLEEDARG